MRTTAPKRNCVVRVLRERRVLSMPEMIAHCHCSRITVLKALQRAGYYTCYNYNAAFYALADTPEFDERGLWCHEHKRFSIHRTLTHTLVQLVRGAPSGYAPAELEALLGVRCGHVLGLLAQRNELHRELEGRHYVYFSPQPEPQQRQKLTRFGPPKPEAALPDRWLPSGLTPQAVIRTLVWAIMEPDATPRQVAARVRAEGTSMSADAVRHTWAFYQVGEKKGN